MTGSFENWTGPMQLRYTEAGKLPEKLFLEPKFLCRPCSEY
jgi:hypothetical protein